ncbi:MAG: 3-oxoacyl-ACP synthase III family protein [Bacteroidales bacterium]|jgi:3-oxoacyl-[acyl-carrier-protein] synthase III|nr:3-oxoacyl-ACP synthase III family protein [Bacteroidales bacterium]
MENNKSGTFVKITGTGSYLPGDPITIDQVDDYLGELTEAPRKIRKWLQRMKELMREMLEVKNYHFAIDPETLEFTDDNITMSVKAAQKALDNAGLKARDIDLIVYGSAHQDQMPTTSVRIQDALGIEQCGEMGIHANCTSAYKALLVAADFIKSGRYKNALVISSSMSSAELRAEYYNQPLVKKEELFLRYFLSDGAGALLLQADEEKQKGLYVESTYMESVGGKKPPAMLNHRPAYWMNPKKEFDLAYHHLSQMFNEQLRTHFHDPDGSVFIKGLKRMFHKYPVDIQKLKYFQVNFPSKHISELIMDECEELGIDRKTLYTKMSDMGYAGPPMAFISIDKIVTEESLNTNDLIISFVTEVSKFMQAGYTLKYY